MSRRILEATRSEEDVSKEMFRVYGDASRDVEKARQKAHALQAEIDDLVRGLDANEQSSPDDLWTESRTTHLRNDLADVRSRKEIAERVVSAAEAMIQSDDYGNRKATVEAAHQALVKTEQAESANVAAAVTNLQMIKVDTGKAVDDAQRFLEGAETGSSHAALHDAISALETYRQANVVKFNNAHEAIQNIDELSEHKEYQTAKDALESVRAESTDIEASRKVYSLLSSMDHSNLALGGWVLHHSSPVFSIQKVALHGSLHEFLGAGGAEPVPLHARVEGNILGRSHVVETEWNPAIASNFVTEVFKSFWDAIGVIRGET